MMNKITYVFLEVESDRGFEQLPGLDLSLTNKKVIAIVTEMVALHRERAIIARTVLQRLERKTDAGPVGISRRRQAERPFEQLYALLRTTTTTTVACSATDNVKKRIWRDKVVGQS